MPRSPRQGKFQRLTDEELDAATTSSEEDNLEEGEGLPEDEPEPEDLAEEQPIMAITYRNLTYDVVTGESIDEDFRRIMCPHCMERGFYSLVGRVQIIEGDKNVLVGPGPVPGGAATIALREPGALGHFPPQTRVGMPDKIAQFILDSHLTSPEAACVQPGIIMDLHLKLARERIRKMNSNDGEEKKKYFAETSQKFPKFDVGMTPEELETNLTSAATIANDTRWRWTLPLKIEVLNKEMSKELKQKIQTDTQKDAGDKEIWTYEDLVAAIRRHAVPKINPMYMARDFPAMMQGESIDEVNAKVHVWIKNMIFASKGTASETIDAIEGRRQLAEGRYNNESVKEMLVSLMLRHFLPQGTANTVRTHEIANNASLSLPNNELLNLVRELESENRDSVNRATYQQGRSGERRRQPDGTRTATFLGRRNFSRRPVTQSRAAFQKRRSELLGDKCARCGRKALTNDHPLKYCTKIAKCGKCGRDSHMTQFCARRPREFPRGASNQMYQCAEEDSEGPSDDDYESDNDNDDVNYAGNHDAEPEWEQATDPEDSEDEQVYLASETFMEIDPTEDKKTDEVAHGNKEADTDEAEDEEDGKHDDPDSDYVEEQNLLKALCKSVRKSIEQKNYSADEMKNSATKWIQTIHEFEEKKGWISEEEMDTARQL